MEKEKKDLSLYGVKKYIHKNVLSRVEGEHLPPKLSSDPHTCTVDAYTHAHTHGIKCHSEA